MTLLILEMDYVLVRNDVTMGLLVKNYFSNVQMIILNCNSYISIEVYKYL